MTATKGFITAAATTALDTRKADAAQVVNDSAGNARVGVLTPNPSIVTSDASTAPMRVAVAKAGFVTQRAAGDGVAIWTNDGSIFVTITAPATNSHIVTVYAKHNDAASGDGSSLPTIAVVTGAAAASPVEAALPAGALKLATVLVPSTATSSQSGGVVITNVYPMTAAAGGVVPVRNDTELTAFAATDGQIAQRIDNDRVYSRIGAQWRRLAFDELIAEWHKNVPAATAGGAGLAASGSSQVIAAVPYARAIRVTVQGGYFPSADGDGGVSVVPSTGAWAGSTNTHRVKGTASLFSDVAYVFYMASLPASTALTLTMTSVTSVTAGYDLHFIIEEIA